MVAEKALVDVPALLRPDVEAPARAAEGQAVVAARQVLAPLVLPAAGALEALVHVDAGVPLEVGLRLQRKGWSNGFVV